MAVPKLAKYHAQWGAIPADTITAAMIDDSIDLVVGSVTASTVTADLTGDVTGNADTATLAAGVEHGEGADILIATLTTAFGDPAGLADGSVFTYAETTSDPDKIYLVIVVDGAFYLEELAAAAAA